MFLLQKRKQKIVALAVGAASVLTVSSAVTVFTVVPMTTVSSSFTADSNTAPNLIAKNNLDLTNSNVYNKDDNLKTITTPKPVNPIKEVPKIIPPKKVEPKKEEPKKEEPKEQPKPIPETKPKPTPQPAPRPAQPKPSRTAGTRVITTTIEVDGVEVEATIELPPDRVISEYDKTNKLANRVPYMSNISGKILSFKVTDELKAKVGKSAVDGLRKRMDNPNDTVGIMTNILSQNNNDANELDKFIRQQPDNWTRLLDRYRRIINSPNVVKFLKEDAKREYPNIQKTENWKNQNFKDYWLISNLDLNKFTKLSNSATQWLSEGLTISPDNTYIDENGEINSYSAGPPDKYNTVTSEMRRNNNEKRVFSYDSWYNRAPGSIKDGSYPGWKKALAPSSEFKQYGIDNGQNGISIFKLTREKPEKDKLNEGYVVEIDSANENAYNKTKKLIEDLKRDNKPITSYRIFNMGKSSAGQSFKDILSVLPKNLPQLELFFDASSTNTSALIALEDKEIKELSLYTDGNSLLDSWSINPFAIRNVEWVNTGDYNVSFDYKRNEKIPTRITFNTLAFDESDYLKDSSDPFKRINDGLRMAYYVRNNEKIFQGSFGPGLNPDNNEGGNSYPTGLDLSRVPQLRSLRGLVFSDKIKSSNSSRKLLRLTLYSDGPNFKITPLDLNEAGFIENFASSPPPSPPPEIQFSNPSTKYVYIQGTGELTSNGISQLSKLLSLAKNSLGSKPTIKVDSNATALKQKLQSSGFTVEEENGDSSFDFT